MKSIGDSGFHVVSRSAGITPASFLYLLPLLILVLFLASSSPAYAKMQGKTSFAVASDDSVFLLIPSAEKKIHHYNDKGVLIKRFVDEGPLDKQLLSPIDIKFWKGNLYVLELFGPQIKVFTPNGKLLMAFGKNLPPDQGMKSPLVMRIRHDEDLNADFIHILDPGMKLIKVYTLEGKFVNSINLPLDYEKYFEWMTSFDIDELGNYWILTDSTDTDTFRHVLVFDKKGLLVKDLTMAKIEGGGFLSDIINQPKGRFVLADSIVAGSGGPYAGTLIFFDEKGNPSEKREIYYKKTSKFYSPRKITYTGDSLYVLTVDDMLLRLDSSFNVVISWSLL